MALHMPIGELEIEGTLRAASARRDRLYTHLEPMKDTYLGAEKALHDTSYLVKNRCQTGSYSHPMRGAADGAQAQTMLAPQLGQGVLQMEPEVGDIAKVLDLAPV